MILFHGSDREIRDPDVFHSRKEVDFGPGFYLTPLEEQAKSWAGKFLRRFGKGVINVYSVDETAFAQYQIKEFGQYSDEWLDFVTQCRRGMDTSTYDIVVGGVANDRVFNTIELYLDKLISREDAIGRLMYERPNLQICIRSQEAIDRYLKFKRSYRL